MVSGMEPAPVGRVLKEHKSRRPECASQMGGESVGGKDEIQLGDQGGEIEKAPGAALGLVHRRVSAVGASVAALQVPEFAIGVVQYGAQEIEGNVACWIPGAARPDEADTEAGGVLWTWAVGCEEFRRKHEVVRSYG